MAERKEYAVLHFFEQGEQCYKISDVTEGRTILECVQNMEKLEKKKIFEWFETLIEQILLYHKCMQTSYGYVNPYGIIITPNDEAVLLDAESKENKEILKRMQKKSFQSIFTRNTENLVLQCEGSDDLFGFGKVLLFVMEKGSFASKFSIAELFQLHRIIKTCGEEQGEICKKLCEIQKKLSRMSQRKILRPRTFGIFFMVGAVAAFFLVCEGMQEKEVVVMEADKASDDKVELDLETERVYLELSMLHYSEREDLSGAKEILTNIQENSLAAQLYLEVLDYIENGNGLSDGRWESLWEQLTSEWERLGVEKKIWYQLPLLDAGKMKNTTESWNVVKNVAEYAEQNKLWNGIVENQEMEFQICQFLGNAYEVLNMEEEEQQKYEQWKALLQEEDGLATCIWYEKWKEQYEMDLAEISGMEEKEEDVLEKIDNVP